MHRRFLPALLLVAVAGCEDHDSSPVAPITPAASVARLDGVGTSPFRVYTQNVYLGGDTGPLFSLDLDDVPAVVAATNTFWQQVGQSAVSERVAAIVDEIAVRRPHVVGLQEVLRFAVLDGSLRPIEGLDLLAEIEREIGERGLPYTTEVVQETTSAALPLAVGQTGVTRWLQFTDRLVVLRCTEVAVTATDEGLYAATVPLGPLVLARGWARVSVDHEGVPHHFLTTHLEVQALAPVQAAQTQQLLGQVLAGLDGVTIVGGDLNSDAAAEPDEPSWTSTYGDMLAAGFADVWELAPRASRRNGFTCCQDPSLRNRVSALDERIDFVLVRSEDVIDRPKARRGHYRIEVVGDQQRDRTSSGLWPADHAGLVASVRSIHVD